MDKFQGTTAKEGRSHPLNLLCLLMASRPSLVTPSGRFDVAQQQVSLSEDAKVEYRPVGLQEIQVEGRVNNAPFKILLTQSGPAHTTINFAPNEYRGVVNPSGLAVYKGSNARDNDSGDCNRK